MGAKAPSIKGVTMTDYQTMLQSWEDLNYHLTSLTERQLEALLSLELQRKMKARISYVKRIHARLCKLRRERELEEMFTDILGHRN